MWRIVIKGDGKRAKYGADADTDDLDRDLVSNGSGLHKKVRANRSNASSKKSGAGSFPSDKRDPSEQSPPISPASSSASATDTEAGSDKTEHDNEDRTSDDQKTLEQALRSGEPLLGRFHWVNQSRLQFGGDAKTPRSERPVMRALKRLGKWVPVLPTTTKTPAQNLPAADT